MRGGSPRGIAFGEGVVWLVCESTPSTLYRIAPRHHSLEPWASVGIAKPRGLTWDPSRRTLWLADGETRTLTELDPASGADRTTLALPPIRYPAGLALSDDTFFLADYENGAVLGLSYPEARERWRRPLAPRPCGLEWIDGRLWAAEEAGSALVCWDPTDGRLGRTEPLPADLRGHGLTGLAWDGTTFWLGDETARAVVRLRPDPPIR